MQTNLFQMQLLQHLQCEAVPGAVVEGVRDLRDCLEATTLEDLYVFFDHLKLSDDDIFTCIGTSGPQVRPPVSAGVYQADRQLVASLAVQLPVQWMTPLWACHLSRAQICAEWLLCTCSHRSCHLSAAGE